MSVKAPKFTGHKPGYSEIWLGERNPRFKGDLSTGKIRRRTPEGVWSWDLGRGSGDFDDEWAPCWYRSPQYGVDKSIERMKDYDKFHGRKTVFLGYFYGI